MLLSCVNFVKFAPVPSQRYVTFIRRCSSKIQEKVRPRLNPGPDLEHFIANAPRVTRDIKVTPVEKHPYIDEESMKGYGRKVYFDVYGCQMNVNDTDVVWSILKSHGYEKTSEPGEADVWIFVTCSIREGAETKIWNKLNLIKSRKAKGLYKKTMKVSVLGCMAERLKTKLLEKDKLVDVVAGPDAYRDLPRLFAIVADDSSNTAINVLLSQDETYANIIPVQVDANSVAGYVSIQRGCDNMCSYCIVPFTRGRERSRPVNSILDEVRYLIDNGVKDVTLLGQNVNSYRDASKDSVTHYGGLSPEMPTKNSEGFKTIYRPKTGGTRFADLLEQVANIDPEVRIRFTSPHPKDFPDEVLHCIRNYKNVCNNIHLPAQSGNSEVLERMRRGYTREAYLSLVDKIISIIPNVTLSSDFICGFCEETDEEFEDTLSLIKAVDYQTLFLFPYSLREKTHAHRKLNDNIAHEVKMQRFNRMNKLYRDKLSLLNRRYIGTEQIVLIQGDSKRSSEHFQGRNDNNVKVIFPKSHSLKQGDYCIVKINECSTQVLKGDVIRHTYLNDSTSMGLKKSASV